MAGDEDKASENPYTTPSVASKPVNETQCVRIARYVVAGVCVGGVAIIVGWWVITWLYWTVVVAFLERVWF